MPPEGVDATSELSQLALGQRQQCVHRNDASVLAVKRALKKCRERDTSFMGCAPQASTTGCRTIDLIFGLDLLLGYQISRVEKKSCNALVKQPCTFTFDLFQCCMTCCNRVWAAEGNQGCTLGSVLEKTAPPQFPSASGTHSPLPPSVHSPDSEDRQDENPCTPSYPAGTHSSCFHISVLNVHIFQLFLLSY